MARSGTKKMIRSVGLVPPEDAAYRAFCSEMAQRNRKLGASREQPASYRLALPLEKAAVSTLAEVSPLVDERIVAYSVRLPGQREWRREYRELDALALWPPGAELAAAERLRIYEVKVSGNPKGLFAGNVQLRRSRKVLSRLRIATVELVLVWVDLVGLGFEDVALDEPPLNKFQLLDAESLAGPPPETGGATALVRLDGRSVTDRAVIEGLLPDDALWLEAREEASRGRERRLARAELREAGVPASEWPDELQDEPVAARPEGQAGDDDEAFGPMNPLAAQLLGLTKRKRD